MLIARAATALVSTILVAGNVWMPTGPAVQPQAWCPGCAEATRGPAPAVATSAPALGTPSNPGAAGKSKRVRNVAAAATDSPLSACSFRVVGHRGTDAGVDRNNTIAAFRQAIADGADVVEMDIRRTAPDDQGQPTWVVNHDATIRGHRISRTSFQTLKDLQPDLATFSEAAQVAARAGVGIEVELKPERVSADGLREALGVLTTMQLRETAVLTSAHSSVLAQLKPLAGPTQLGVIVREPADPESVKKFADRVLIRDNLITAEYVAEAHAHDLFVEVWTVDDVDGWHTFSRYGVDGVITDKAAAVTAWCASESDRPIQVVIQPELPGRAQRCHALLARWSRSETVWSSRSRRGIVRPGGV